MRQKDFTVISDLWMRSIGITGYCPLLELFGFEQPGEYLLLPQSPRAWRVRGYSHSLSEKLLPTAIFHGARQEASPWF